MINIPLLRTTVRYNYIIWLIFAFILALYISIILSMFDPDTLNSMNVYLETLPPELIAAMNFQSTEFSLLGFLAAYFYGFLILLFPLIYSIIMADRMIAKLVDSGSMAFLLSTPNSRIKIALTQAVFLLGSLLLLIGCVTLVGIIVSQAFFPGELDIPRFIRLNLGAVLLYIALSGIGFFASCLFNESKHSLAFGGGIPVAFLLLQMLSSAGEQVSNLKYLSLMTLFDPNVIIAGGDTVGLVFLVFTIVALVMYVSGIYIFSKKDLHI
jgi:ABC-2 type transport system permease protein